MAADEIKFCDSGKFIVTSKVRFSVRLYQWDSKKNQWVYILQTLSFETRDKAHGVLSSELARPIFEQIQFPPKKIERTPQAIRVHDVTAQNRERHSIESKIFFDAEILDSFGIVGVVRNILSILIS